MLWCSANVMSLWFLAYAFKAVLKVTTWESLLSLRGRSSLRMIFTSGNLRRISSSSCLSSSRTCSGSLLSRSFVPTCRRRWSSFLIWLFLIVWETSNSVPHRLFLPQFVTIYELPVGVKAYEKFKIYVPCLLHCARSSSFWFRVDMWGFWCWCSRLCCFLLDVVGSCAQVCIAAHIDIFSSSLNLWS